MVTGIWDGYPVSPGHALLVPRRHIASWFEASNSERHALMEAIAIARDAILERYLPDGFNVGINVGEYAGQTVMHLHVHLIPRYRGDTADPRGGVRHVIPSKGNYLAGSTPESPARLMSGNAGPAQSPLITGGPGDPLLPQLTEALARATSADIAVAFVQPKGVLRLQSHFDDLLARGGRLRVVTGDYQDITDPDALMQLLDLAGDAHVRVFETTRRAVGARPFGRSFHPKAYLLHQGDGGTGFVGSSNISELALTDGIEWNYRVAAGSAGDGWPALCVAFERLWSHDATSPLTEQWVDDYRRRRRAPSLSLPPLSSLQQVDEVLGGDDHPSPPVEPHEIQREALNALVASRADGNRAGLVVLATGLGKTWLAAFDTSRPEFSRVLFVAHREEILQQAQRTFRAIRPTASLGLYTGTEKAADADVLFASIQTIGRQAHLARFEPSAFDYVVIDEFHHAAAASYRRLLAHFSPKFLLGLTATPERTDGGDLLQLCNENLVYRRDLTDGINAGLLCPFRYVGVPDDVDYANIPWRNAAFDEEALTTAVATTARAQNALDQWRKHAGPGARTLAFCVSQRHADFMARFFVENGLRAVAVHSGPTSAPRALSLEQLERQELDVVCAVDMFNEGVDLPHLDCVLMLRPTESKVVWLQQFGRGLRKAEGKERLRVVDYIGNHKVFLIKPRTLFNLPAGRQAVYDLMLDAEAGRFELPMGCEVTYELGAIDILKQLARPSGRADEALRRYYEDFRDLHGVRPTASEAYHDGYAPRSVRTAHGSWMGFVEAMGDLPADQKAAYEAASEFLGELETTSMTRSFKMLVMKAMLDRDALPGRLAIGALTEAVFEVASRSALLASDLGDALGSHDHLSAMLQRNPVAAWTGEWARTRRPQFAFANGIFSSEFTVDPERRAAFQALARELVDWRLAEYLDRPRLGAEDGAEFTCKVSHASGRPIIFLPTGTDRQRLPMGSTALRVEGSAVTADFKKVAINVVRGTPDGPNELAAILRRWFGHDAGLPGTRHLVTIALRGGDWHLEPASRRQDKPVRWQLYSREQIPPLFGLEFSTAVWNVGYVRRSQQIFLLVTLDKGGLPQEFQYGDRFLAPDILEWHSQNRTTRSSADGRAIAAHREEGTPVHLFVRRHKRSPRGGSAPFFYCGDVEFVDWEGDSPITIRWRLPEAVPERLQSDFGISRA